MANDRNPQQPKTSSWAEKVRVSDSSTRCQLERLERQPRGSILQIPNDMLMANVDTWRRSMIGFFISYKMPYYAIQSIANRAWKSYGLEKITVLDNGFMVFRFPTEEAIEEVLAKGPWLFGGKTILLQKWHPCFQFDKNKITTLPVWARLKGLPFPLWNKHGLSLAASMVGTPLACDEATLQCNRLEYARVCVELKASLPPVHSFEVASSLTEDPVTVEVEYEWKPARCATCKVFGHSCKIQEATVNVDAMTTVKGIEEVQLPHEGNKEKHAVADLAIAFTETKASVSNDDEFHKEKHKNRTVQLVQRTATGKPPSRLSSGDAVNIDEEDRENDSDSSTHGVLSKTTADQPIKEVMVYTRDPGKLPQCVESKMDSLSCTVSSKDGEDDTGSSMCDKTLTSHNGSNTPSPKTKRRKGKKKREAGRLH
ncbi:hypothetical protein SADUNF_Sadunf02G0208400 [Salix dunnii]|uniref:DUF4283 domain-containing protein n=1 Tax=Salix dunnii TaxID=1413687 RepID=A0A835TLA9_9ROSI|nr:hypothetical protein SADUNF_Sadunf02G0208400 [Salix dunnii]